MSNLLSDAIVDAKALREAALKSAETAVIEKYSSEVKKTLDQLLEQDDLDLNLGGDMDLGAEVEPALDPDPALDMGVEEVEGPVEPIDEEDNVPLAATDDFSDLEGENLEDFPASGEPVELTLDLGALQEAIENLQESEEVEIDEEMVASLVSDAIDEEVAVAADDAAVGDAEETEAETDEFEKSGLEEYMGGAHGRWADADAGFARCKAKCDPDDAECAKECAEKWPHPTYEDMDLDKLADEIMEKLTVDMGATLSGWAGRSSEDQKWEIEKALAHRRSTDVEEDLKTLKKAHDELVFENNQINERNNQYKQVVEELRESLHDVNLSNARLLYTNRVLRNSSLNERQKEKIVEAISNAGSVTEAKTIYETLQSTVEAKPKRSPQSLSEAISNRSSVIRATRKESPSNDPLQDRMKRLAGIK